MADNHKLEDFYQYVLENGKLRTTEHARRWSNGVLRTLGINLDRGVKKNLAKTLPEELASSLTRVFWLLHFRDRNLSREEFQRMVARRSGNSDADFAYYPILAIFGGLKMIVDDDVQREVAEHLAPEISDLWKQA